MRRDVDITENFLSDILNIHIEQNKILDNKASFYHINKPVLAKGLIENKSSKGIGYALSCLSKLSLVNKLGKWRPYKYTLTKKGKELVKLIDIMRF